MKPCRRRTRPLVCHGCILHLVLPTLLGIESKFAFIELTDAGYLFGNLQVTALAAVRVRRWHGSLGSVPLRLGEDTTGTREPNPGPATQAGTRHPWSFQSWQIYKQSMDDSAAERLASVTLAGYKKGLGALPTDSWIVRDICQPGFQSWLL